MVVKQCRQVSEDPSVSFDRCYWRAVGDWGPWFLWALFAAILVWEEVWDLPQTAYLSAWLLIIITVGAMVCSWFFERRLWCRHLCPIGGMNGMFAKLSMTELRAQPGVCSGVPSYPLVMGNF